MKTITVLLAEDHMFVREGFRKMLELEDDHRSAALADFFFARIFADIGYE
jgi:DNA-binding NarL/FixJ family response regulator